MPSPLATGEIPLSPITPRLRASPPPTSCLTTYAELASWIESFGVEFTLQQVGFSYSAGTVDTATPEQRAFPRLIFSDTGRFIGLAIYDPTLGKWVTGAILGELKTVVRADANIDVDMENKGFVGTGWHLADGTAGTVDLTANPGFFTGTGPNWDVYTVEYTGI